MFRRIAEIYLGSITLKRRLPTGLGGGIIVANAKVGGLKYLFKPVCKWDPELVRIAGELVNRSAAVWDVGANVGLFSVVAAHHAGRGGEILALEADVDAVRLLNETRRHLDENAAPVNVLAVALDTAPGIVRFSVAKRARAANAMAGYGSSQMGGVKEVRLVPAMSLDALLDHFRQPDILKIDVEGAECRVLSGAGEVLEKVRPKIYCEVDKTNRPRVFETLTRYKYAVYDGRSFPENRLSPATQCYRNTIAVPREAIHMS